MTVSGTIVFFLIERIVAAADLFIAPTIKYCEPSGRTGKKLVELMTCMGYFLFID